MIDDSDFILGGATVYPSLNMVETESGKVTLPPRAMKLLVYLSLNQGVTLSKNDIAKNIWQRVIVSDASIAKAVSEIRKSINDDANDPKYIKTVSKQGFRCLVQRQSFSQPNIIDINDTGKVKNNAGQAFGLSRQLIGISISALIVLGTSIIDKWQPLKSQVIGFGTPLRETVIGIYESRPFSPSYNLDGNSVVFENYQRDRSRLIAKNLVTGEDKILIQDRQDPIIYPKYSHFDQNISFISFLPNSCKIISFDILNRLERELFQCAKNALPLGFDISIDGKIMALSLRIKRDGSPQQSEIRVWDLTTNTELASFTGSEVDFHTLAINESMKSVAFVQRENRNENDQIKTLNWRTETIETMGDAVSEITQLIWIENEIHYTRASGPYQGIWRIAEQSGEHQYLYNGPVTEGDYNELQRKFVFNYYDFKTQVVRVGLDSQESSHVELANFDKVLREVTMKDQNKKAYVTIDRNFHSVYVVEGDSQKPHRWFKSKEGMIEDLWWSQAQNRLFVTELVKDKYRTYALTASNVDLKEECDFLENGRLMMDLGTNQYLCNSMGKGQSFWYDSTSGETQLVEQGFVVRAKPAGTGKVAFATNNSPNLFIKNVHEDTVSVWSTVKLSNRKSFWDVVEGSVYFLKRPAPGKPVNIYKVEDKTSSPLVLAKVDSLSAIGASDIEVDAVARTLSYSKRITTDYRLVELEKIYD